MAAKISVLGPTISEVSTGTVSLWTSSVNSILKAMNDTVYFEPSLGVVRIFSNIGRFFSTRESTLVLTGWTLSYDM